MFRATRGSPSPQSVAGFGAGGSPFLGINARSAMIQGGLIDGLADLSKAFINAPIARRKNDLMERKLQQDEQDRQEMRQLRAAQIANEQAKLANEGNAPAKPITGPLINRLDQDVKDELGVNNLISTDPAAIGIHNRRYLQAGINPNNYAPLGEKNPYSVPNFGNKSPADTESLASSLATTPAPPMDNQDHQETDLSQPLYPEAQTEDLGNQFEGGSPDSIAPAQAITPQPAPQEADAADVDQHANAIHQLLRSGNKNGAKQWATQMRAENGNPFAEKVKRRVRQLGTP